MKKIQLSYLKIYKTAVLFLLFLTSDCGITNKMYHDNENPCAKGEFQNGLECDNWKKNFPREYEKYVKRLQNKSKE